MNFAISICHASAYTLTTKVNSRHTRVYELEEDHPLLVEYRALSDRRHTLQGEIGKLYHHA